MQNRPTAISITRSWMTINGYTLWYNVGNSWPYNENISTKIVEKLIRTLTRLGIGTDYYEDYGCSDREQWLNKLNIAIKHWQKTIKRAKKRLYRKDWIRFDELLETRLLVNSGRHLQSHQLTQALKLVGQISRYQYPSFSLVDSS